MHLKQCLRGNLWHYMLPIKKNLKNKDLSTCFKKPQEAAQMQNQKGRKKQFNQNGNESFTEVQQHI